MKTIIEELKISDSDLIANKHSYTGSAIAILKTDRIVKAIVTKEADCYSGVELKDMRPTFIFSNGFEMYDFYKIGKIKLTVEI